MKSLGRITGYHRWSIELVIDEPKAVGWLAEHVWLFVTGVGATVIILKQNQRKTNS